MITRVYHLFTDRVVAFDEKNQRVPECDGRFDEVIDKVMAETTGSTKFFVQHFTMPVARDLFRSKKVFNMIKTAR